MKLWGTSTASPEPYGDGAIVDMSSGAILLIGDDAFVRPEQAPRRVEVEFRTAPGDNHYGVLLSTGTGGEATREAFNVRIHVGGEVGVMGVDRDWDVDPDPIDVFDGEWHTLVVDYDGTHLRMWLDGVQLGHAPPSPLKRRGRTRG